MNKEEQKLVEEAKTYYYTYRLTECLDSVEKFDTIERSFSCHQLLQMYKGLSLFEQSNFKEGYKCLDRILEESDRLKGDKSDANDIVLRVLYQVQIYYIDNCEAERRNEDLKRACENYRLHNQANQDYEHGIYLFGIGIYRFIETNRDEEDLDFIPDLLEAHELAINYQQDIMNFLAWIYYSKEKLEESEKWSMKLYNLNPRYPGIANNLAIVLNNKGEDEKAEQLYREAELLCPYNHVVLHNSAYYYEKKGNVEKEQEYYEKAYNLTPRSSQACYKYGRFLLKQNKKEEALKVLTQGVEIDPTVQGNYEQLAQLAYSENDFETAIKHLETCVSLKPDEGYYYFRLGDIQESSSQFDKAIESYKKSIEIKNYKNIKVSANSRIAYCYYCMNDCTKSLEEYFNTCNNKCKSYSFDTDVQSVTTLINHFFNIPLNEMVNIINKQEGYSLEKFLEISNQIENPNMKAVFLKKLDILRSVISLIAYKKLIQSHITYQNQLSHLDIYFD